MRVRVKSHPGTPIQDTREGTCALAQSVMRTRRSLQEGGPRRDQ